MERSLEGKEIILGVTGSIAAYKAVEILRELTRRGAAVTVVMTESAQRFVAPLTFETLSRRPLLTDLFTLEYDKQIGHVALAGGGGPTPSWSPPQPPTPSPNSPMAWPTTSSPTSISAAPVPSCSPPPWIWRCTRIPRSRIISVASRLGAFPSWNRSTVSLPRD